MITREAGCGGGLRRPVAGLPRLAMCVRPRPVVRAGCGGGLRSAGIAKLEVQQTDRTTRIIRQETNPKRDQSVARNTNGNRIDGDTVIGPNNQILSDGTFDYEYDADVQPSSAVFMRSNVPSGRVLTKTSPAVNPAAAPYSNAAPRIRSKMYSRSGGN